MEAEGQTNETNEEENRNWSEGRNTCFYIPNFASILVPSTPPSSLAYHQKVSL